LTFKGQLRPFQEEAVEMMLDRKHLLLAHDMGLGKTVSSIAACEQLIDTGEAESILVIAPASIKWQWLHQIKKFTDGGLVKVIEGNKNERTAQYRAVNRGDYEYVIMNYEQVVNDWDIVRHLIFDVVICDEVVAIKSPGAKRTRHVRRLRTPYRFGLSGQPIENKPEELFSIMCWVDKDVLGSPEVFDKLFVVRDRRTGRVKLYKNLPMLRERMGDAMHRKTRHEVADQMPSVVEQSYLVDFDPATKKTYKYVARELIDLIRTSQTYGSFNLFDHYAGVNGEGDVQGKIMARLMALRMLCDHPGLLDYSADHFEDPDAKAGSAYIAELRTAGLFTRLKSAPKADVTIEWINEILDADPRNKIVLFSFFKPMLAILADRLKVGHEMFTGDYSVRERDAAVQRFTKLKSCRVLLSSDAGGIGLDLPAANYLISYDQPWSSGKFQQRKSRIIRISSKWPEVTVLTMMMRYSIEERMADMLEEKAAVASAWIDGKGVDKHGRFTLTLDSLADYLEDSLLDL
jgi:SNF2 family DNA or RNA helicase